MPTMGENCWTLKEKSMDPEIHLTRERIELTPLEEARKLVEEADHYGRTMASRTPLSKKDIVRAKLLQERGGEQR